MLFWLLSFCIKCWYFINLLIVYTSKRNVITKHLISQSNQKCNFMILCNHFIQRWAWYLFFCPFEDPPYKHWQHWKTLKACTVLLITTQTQICFLIINKVTISVVVYNVSSTSLHLYLHKHVSQNNIQEPNSRRGRNTLNMSDLSVLLAREQYGRRRNKKFILWTTI